MGIKEIIGSGNGFITKWRVEMPGLDIEAVTDRHVCLQIGLRKRYAISACRFTAQIEIPIPPIRRRAGILIEGGNAESLGINSIRTEQKIETATEIPFCAFRWHGTLYK